MRQKNTSEPAIPEDNRGGNLRAQRERAGLSQEQLAKAAGLSVRTLRNVELGHADPSEETARRLRAVEALHMSPAADPTPPDPTDDLRPNSWLAPHYDVLKLSQDMIDVLNSPGGTFEQTFLYLDGASAAEWIKLSTATRYAAANRDSIPLDQVAAQILPRVAGHGLDIHALGAGDGRSETRLVQYLTDGRPEGTPDIRMCLLDISPVMQNVAYRHAADALERRGVAVFALAGNFHEIRRIPVMSYRPAGSDRRRLYTMLGVTVSNLADEARWFRELAACAAPGDLVVFDFRLARAPAGDVEAIRAAEPSLSGGPPPTHFEWLGGPIERHVRGVQNVDFRMDLIPHGQVPGSYELDWVAEARLKDGSRREFVMLRGKCHDPEQLAAFVRPLGWEPILSDVYGPQGAQHHGLLVLQRA